MCGMTFSIVKTAAVRSSHANNYMDYISVFV